MHVTYKPPGPINSASVFGKSFPETQSRGISHSFIKHSFLSLPRQQQPSLEPDVFYEVGSAIAPLWPQQRIPQYNNEGCTLSKPSTETQFTSPQIVPLGCIRSEADMMDTPICEQKYSECMCCCGQTDCKAIAAYINRTLSSVLD